MNTEQTVKLHAEAWLRNDIYQAVIRERAYHQRRFGDQLHSQEFWNQLMMEELGEAVRSTLESDDANYKREVLQLIALGFAILEQYGVEEREENLGQE